MKTKYLFYASVPIAMSLAVALWLFRPNQRRTHAPLRPAAADETRTSDEQATDRASLPIAAAIRVARHDSAPAVAPPLVEEPVMPRVEEQPVERELPAAEDQVAHLDLVYSQEDLDPAWSREGERAVRALLTPITGNSTMESVECRSSLCRVQAKHGNEADFLQFIGGMIDNSREAWKGGLYSVRDPSPPDGVIRNVVFLAKEGPIPLLE